MTKIGPFILIQCYIGDITLYLSVGFLSEFFEKINSEDNLSRICEDSKKPLILRSFLILFLFLKAQVF